MEIALLSPHFLYRTELGTGQGDVRTLTQHEIASAISFLLIGAPPDDQLRAAADAGQLSAPEVRATHAARLLGTDAARDLVGRFGMMWLGAEEVTSAHKSAAFDALDGDVRRSMADATRTFFVRSFLDDDATVHDVLTADESLYNDTLLAFYGEATTGSDALSPGPFPDEGRKGILGHGSLLASYAYPDQTSPVRRGLFVRERLLCQDLGYAAGQRGGHPRDRSGRHHPRALRAAREQRAVQCNACPRYIDDVGFGFEHYDPIGRWRDTDNGHPIDATGLLRGVEHFGDGTARRWTSWSPPWPAG